MVNTSACPIEMMAYFRRLVSEPLDTGDRLIDQCTGRNNWVILGMQLMVLQDSSRFQVTTRASYLTI